MAAGDASRRKPTAFHGTEAVHGDHGVFRAGRDESATLSEKGTQPAFIQAECGDQQSVDQAVGFAFGAAAVALGRQWRGDVDAGSDARSHVRQDTVAAAVFAGYNSPLSRLKGTYEGFSDVAAKKPVAKAHKATSKAPAKPAAKPASKAPSASAKPAAKKAVAKTVAKKPAPAAKPVAKPAVKPAAKSAAKPVAKPAAKPVAKAAVKAAAKPADKPAAKVAAKPTAKAAPAKTAPAKPAVAAKPVATQSVPSKAEPAKAAPIKQAPTKPAPTAKVEPAKVPAPAAAPKPAPAKPAAPAQPAASAKPAATTKPADVKPVVAVTPRPAMGKVAVAVAAKPVPPAPRNEIKIIPYKTDESTGRPILPAGYKPSRDEEYMGPLQLEYFRQRLLNWRADLIEESKQTIENLKDEVRDVGDDAERATRETENSLELRTRDRYRKLIGKIDSTLKRLDAGEYGFSVDSGEEIGLDRLEARLTAERTIDEQERWEHLQKQQGD